MDEFPCPRCGTVIHESPQRDVVNPDQPFEYWRCGKCHQCIPADVDGEPLFDGDVVELIAQDDPADFDASVGDQGTIALANHVCQEGGPAVLPWGGFYPPSTLRLVRRGEP